MASQGSAASVAKEAEKRQVYIDPEVVARRRAEKAAKKKEQRLLAKKQQDENPSNGIEDLGFAPRKMIQLRAGQAETPGGKPIKLMTWNMLAQALVRRTLFPGCDILKWKDRGPILTKVIKYYMPDVACLQEVDKIDHHGPIFKELGYDYAYATGYTAKLHGLCLIWRRDRFEKVRETIVKLDDAVFNGDRSGCSRRTRNIGLLVALKEKDTGKGLVLTTHHLFWHARHVYERTRQTAMLLREIDHFRQDGESGWPCFFAGDFNIQPSEATYRLMTGAELSAQQVEALQMSTVVHSSYDEYKRKLLEQERAENGQAEEQDDGDEDEDDDDKPAGEEYAQPDGDEDRVLKNTRPARESDGLLSLSELKSMYAKYTTGIQSIYGTHVEGVQSMSDNVFGERSGEPEGQTPSENKEQRIKEGYFEPAYTNVTPLWRCTLDYIFIVPPQGQTAEDVVQVTHLLPTHRLADLEPGLPRLGKEPSDHIPIMAQLVLR